MKMRFNKYIGIDYSGAETPTSSLKGLRVYEAKPNSNPVEVPPPPGYKRYWSRRGLTEWIIEQVSRPEPCIIGIDHAFSFPLKYFEKYKLPLDWSAFLDDFQAHWPTDEDIYVDFVREGVDGNGAARMGVRKWRRMTELLAGSAKSVFHFDVHGQVAKSTHSGLPQLRHIRNKVGSRVHFWPFDGWSIPAGKSAIVEVYPRLWNRNYPPADRTPDQHDAYCVASWLQEVDRVGELELYLNPELSPEHRRIASIEGWILGLKDNPHEGSSIQTWLKGESRDPAFGAGLEKAGTRRRVARQIYDARMKAGISQPELARRLKTSLAAVSLMESGSQNMTIEALENIARALGGRFEGQIILDHRP